MKSSDIAGWLAWSRRLAKWGEHGANPTLSSLRLLYISTSHHMYGQPAYGYNDFHSQSTHHVQQQGCCMAKDMLEARFNCNVVHNLYIRKQLHPIMMTAKWVAGLENKKIALNSWNLCTSDLREEEKVALFFGGGKQVEVISSPELY